MCYNNISDKKFVKAEWELDQQELGIVSLGISRTRKTERESVGLVPGVSRLFCLYRFILTNGGEKQWQREEQQHRRQRE